MEKELDFKKPLYLCNRKKCGEKCSNDCYLTTDEKYADKKINWKEILKIFKGHGNYNYTEIRKAFNEIENLIKREIAKEENGLQWIDNADSWICPVCGFETRNPHNYKGCKCPVCGFQAWKDKGVDDD